MTCTVVSARPLAEGICELIFDAPPMAAEARPGQFVHIACGHSRLLRRPISICEARGHHVRIIFTIRGEGTRWLSERRPGDALDVLGPLGCGFSAPDGARVLLVGGGAGVAPLLFCARHRGWHTRAILGFRSASLSYLTDEFVHHPILCTDDGTLGRHGLVDAVVREEGGRFDAVFACGPVPMLRAVAAVAEELGLACQVSLEERMGCGVGACLVCACAVKSESDQTVYRHVCKDGPVFDSREVVWS